METKSNNIVRLSDYNCDRRPYQVKGGFQTTAEKERNFRLIAQTIEYLRDSSVNLNKLSLMFSNIAYFIGTIDHKKTRQEVIEASIEVEEFWTDFLNSAKVHGEYQCASTIIFYLMYWLNLTTETTKT